MGCCVRSHRSKSHHEQNQWPILPTQEHNNNPEPSLLRRKLIDASHILHYHGVLDAYGQVSFRHPFRPDLFVMSRSMAPGTVSSPEDLVTYNVADASPVGETQAAGFIERMIHSEMCKRHPQVQSVVHCHSEDVVSYSIAGVPFPCSLDNNLA